MNIPNLLTSLRILAIPALVIILLSSFNGSRFIAAGLFILAALTDMFDGILARRNQQITTFGKLLDPIADKLLIASVYICLVELGAVSSWMVIIIIGREIAVTGFRAIAASKGYTIAASSLGKAKMWLEVITGVILILGPKILGQLYFLGKIGLWLVIIVALSSALEYYLKFNSLVLRDKS